MIRLGTTTVTGQRVRVLAAAQSVTAWDGDA